MVRGHGIARQPGAIPPRSHLRTPLATRRAGEAGPDVGLNPVVNSFSLAITAELGASGEGVPGWLAGDGSGLTGVGITTASLATVPGRRPEGLAFGETSQDKVQFCRFITSSSLRWIYGLTLQRSF